MIFFSKHGSLVISGENLVKLHWYEFTTWIQRRKDDNVGTLHQVHTFKIPCNHLLEIRLDQMLGLQCLHLQRVEHFICVNTCHLMFSVMVLKNDFLLNSFPIFFLQLRIKRVLTNFSSKPDRNIQQNLSQPIFCRKLSKELLNVLFGKNR